MENAFCRRRHQCHLDFNEMGSQIVGVVVAGCFSVLVALIHTMRKENRKDHGEVQKSLGRIEQKIDGHMENHG